MDKFITDERIAAQGGLERPGPFGVGWGRWEGPWKLMFPLVEVCEKYRD